MNWVSYKTGGDKIDTWILEIIKFQRNNDRMNVSLTYTIYI